MIASAQLTCALDKIDGANRATRTGKPSMASRCRGSTPTAST